MPQTPNHGYNVPSEGAQDWHEPLNENFERYDVDIELRDQAANLDDYEPEAGAKFLATDTGVVYVGDGSDWLATLQAGQYTPPTEAGNAGSVAFGDPDNDTGEADGATVGGGDGNEASGDGSTVGGGESNRANDSEATIGGGSLNRASSQRATVGGGYRNRADGDGSTVPGGRQNRATGDYSLAAGRQALALHAGSFVWNNSGSRFSSGDDNQFLVNAVGGVGIGTVPDAPLHVGATDDPAMDGDLMVGSSDHRFWVDVATDGSQSGSVRLRARGENSVGVHNLYLGGGSEDIAHVRGSGGGLDRPSLLPTEDSETFLGYSSRRWFRCFVRTLNADIVLADSVLEGSDAKLKRNVSRLEDGLRTVVDLRPVTYEWKDEERDDGTQLGLIAQEVEDVLPEVVEWQGDDEDGHLAVKYTRLVPVLVDAIQRQQAGIEERDERIDELEAEHERKDERIDDLEARLTALEAQVAPDAGPAPADD
jgi:hypothetical protein